MSAAEWTGETSELAKPPKKRVPTWIWACGGGCALVVIVGVLLAALGFKYVSKMMDQDAQWQLLAEHLPFETPPPGVTIMGFPIKMEGTSVWVLTDAGRKQSGTLLAAPPGPDASQTRDELFDATKEVSVMGMGRYNLEPGEVEVQGRRLESLRYTSRSGEGEGGFFDKLLEQMQGASVAVDLAPEGSEELLVLILTRQGTSERIEDAAVVEFLEPFRIPGSNKPVPAEPPPAAQPPDEGR